MNRALFGLWSLRLLMFKWFRDYLFRPHDRFTTGRLSAIWCRLRQHPAGPAFYNATGLEPDYHCLNCGDDLG